VHFIQSDHINAGSGADGPNGPAIRLDPVVGGNVAALQDPAAGTLEYRPVSPAINGFFVLNF